MTATEVIDHVEEAYRDWHGLLANRRFCRDGNRIAWTKYDVGIIREPITYEKVRSLVETKQYSFQCAEDGSVFQLLYEFDAEDRLLLARLAFYHAEVALLDEAQGQVLPDFSGETVPWLRIDYTDQYATGVLHHSCHLHLSGFPYARILVNGVPGPRQFVEFVVATCYPDYYKVHRLNEIGKYVDKQPIRDVNTCRIPASADELPNILMHFRVP